MIQLWAVFAILAAFIWAVTNIIDKYAISKLISRPIMPTIILANIALIAGVLILIIHGFGTLNFWQILLAMVSGSFYIFMILLFFKAVQIEEVSTLVPLFYLAPLFVSVMAWLLLSERLLPENYMGVILLVCGAFLISWNKKSQFKFGKAFQLMVAAAFLSAANQVINKYLLNFSDFWIIYAYMGIGSFLAMQYFFIKNFSYIIIFFKEKKKALGFIIASQLMNQTAVLVRIYAISIGSVALVSAISSVQPFFTLSFAVLSSLFIPQVLKENIAKSRILLKLAAILIMFVGAILVT